MTRSLLRSRTRTKPSGAGPHPIATPNGISSNTGPIASASWLVALGLHPEEPKWFVEIDLDASDIPTTQDFDEKTATRFRIEIYAEEWGLMFCHAGQLSWIRVTDTRFVHGRDEHGLLRETPPLRSIGRLIRALEARFGIELKREHALVRTSISDAEPAIARWLEL